MRCRACNKNLNDFESTRKSESGEYVDLCNHCYREVQSDILAEEAHEIYTNDGVYGEQAWILARDEALNRYNNGLYDQTYYKD